MRILVTGGSGQVVSALLERGAMKGHLIIPVVRPLFDLGNPSSIFPAISAAHPDIVVSAAAYTAVDRAEAEPQLAHAVNAVGAGEVARAAQRLGVPVIHLSTDYVFDGLKETPWVESDPTGPLCVYGTTKLAGEQLVAQATWNHVILRVAWIYSPFANNFVKTMLRLARTHRELSIVADQHGTPSSALDVADAVIEIAVRLVSDPNPNLRGVFHLAPTGETSWAEFAEEIFEISASRGGPTCGVRRITTVEYPTAARRPANSRLDGRKLVHRFGVRQLPWRASLLQCVDSLLTSRTPQ